MVELGVQGAGMIRTLHCAARTTKSSPVSCSSSPRPAETELVERGGVGGSWTELVIPGVVSALDLQGTVELDIPEAVFKLDLESELNLQGVVPELDIVARTMKSSPVSCSSSPRPAETELADRGGVSGAGTELAELAQSMEILLSPSPSPKCVSTSGLGFLTSMKCVRTSVLGFPIGCRWPCTSCATCTDLL